MKKIYFIPIRKGSKGVPGKNMKILGGKPLLAWIVDAILASETASEIWVATDSDEAGLFLSRERPEVRVFRRSAGSSTDTSPVIEVVMEFLNHYRFSADDYFILAQTTSPFTSPEDLKTLATAIDSGMADSFISCHRLKKFVWHPDGYPLSYTLDSKPMRQQYAGLLIESGAFYASSIGCIRQSGLLLSGKIKVIEPHSSHPLDIDTMDDWDIAEAICSRFMQ